jgi:hypothetical protein
MTKENREGAVIGLILSLLICVLGGWLFYLKSDGYTVYGFFGLRVEAGMAAAIVSGLGIVALFFSIKRIAQYSKAKNTKV